MMRAAKGLLLAAAITPLLGACVIYDSSADDTVSVRVGSNSATATGPKVETLRAVRFEPGAVIVRADSNGCTNGTSFAVHIAEDEGPTRLSLTRETPDNCDALIRDGVELRWTYEELGLKPGTVVTIGNPIRLP